MPSLRGGPLHGQNLPLQEPYRPCYKHFDEDGRYTGAYVLTSVTQKGGRKVRHFLWHENYDPVGEQARERERDAGGRFLRLLSRLRGRR